MNGPGKYDEETSLIMEATQAKAVIMIVMNGDKGSGFSVQTVDKSILAMIPDMLESMAREIRATA